MALQNIRECCFQEEATAHGEAGQPPPYFAINREEVKKKRSSPLRHFSLFNLLGKIVSEKKICRGASNVRNAFREEFREGFDRSSTFFIRSSSFFDLQRVSTSNQAFRFILCTRSGPHCVSCIFILVLFTFIPLLT
ncbi:hypothetical protein GmHk_01G001464 [Glycine max]|nr:hypothetical protein GmHk_01G001464 [Glycine max]